MHKIHTRTSEKEMINSLALFIIIFLTFLTLSLSHLSPSSLSLSLLSPSLFYVDGDKDEEEEEENGGWDGVVVIEEMVIDYGDADGGREQNEDNGRGGDEDGGRLLWTETMTMVVDRNGSGWRWIK